jgi:hypothetical protein
MREDKLSGRKKPVRLGYTAGAGGLYQLRQKIFVFLISKIRFPDQQESDYAIHIFAAENAVELRTASAHSQ